MRKIVVEVHNDSVFVCILGENGDKIQEKFGIFCLLYTSDAADE